MSMKALGFKIPNDTVLEVAHYLRDEGTFRAFQVREAFERRGVSPLISTAAADNLLRRMKRAELIHISKYPFWSCN